MIHPSRLVAFVLVSAVAVGCVSASPGEASGETDSALASPKPGPREIVLENLDTGRAIPVRTIIGNRDLYDYLSNGGDLYARLEDACIIEGGALVWLAGAWVVSVGGAWWATDGRNRIGPFSSSSAAQSTVMAARRTRTCTSTCYIIDAARAGGTGTSALCSGRVSGQAATCQAAQQRANDDVAGGCRAKHCQCKCR